MHTELQKQLQRTYGMYILHGWYTLAKNLNFWYIMLAVEQLE